MKNRRIQIMIPVSIEGSMRIIHWSFRNFNQLKKLIDCFVSTENDCGWRKTVEENPSCRVYTKQEVWIDMYLSELLSPRAESISRGI